MKENRDKPIEDIKYYKQLYYPQKGNKSNFLSAMFKQ